MTMNHEAFRRDLDALIDKHWPDIGPHQDEDLDPLDRAEAGQVSPNAWILVVASSSFEDDPMTLTSTWSRPHQHPHTSIGLLVDGQAMRVG